MKNILQNFQTIFSLSLIPHHASNNTPLSKNSPSGSFSNFRKILRLYGILHPNGKQMDFRRIIIGIFDGVTMRWACKNKD